MYVCIYIHIFDVENRTKNCTVELLLSMGPFFKDNKKHVSISLDAAKKG